MGIKKQKIIAAAFIHKDGKLLIAKRANSKKFMPGVFELPGGHIEYGETMENGLAREIKEEFHIDVKIGEPIHVFTYMHGNTGHAIEVDYLATMIKPTQEIRLNPEDHSEYRWVSRSNYSRFLAGNEKEREAARKGFKRLLNI